jgi:AraC-like DNA-binding protein
MRATVSTDLVTMLIKYASKIGINTEKILIQAGIGNSTLSNSYERIELEKFGILWNEVLIASNDPDFGLNYGISGYSIKGGGILASILKNCPNLGVAIEKLFRYHDLSGELSQFELAQQGSHISIIVKPFHPGINLRRHSAETILAALFSSLYELSGGNITFLEIHFAHPRPENISSHNAIFKTDLVFGTKLNKLIFEEKFLSQSIFLANDMVFESLQHLADKQINFIKSANYWSNEVKRKIGEVLLNGDKPEIEGISSELNLSTRNLQNKLKKESSSYQLLLDEVRHEISLLYIEKPETTLSDLAFLLAFSDQSAFSHSFKRWTGISPMEFRKKLNLKNQS